MQLRGCDDYEITLGDEIRGERASLGKSLADAERELRIRSELLLGIENCDLSAFPNPSVVAGYVRSYARYLRMDVEQVYNRFCSETGFEPPNRAFAATGRSGAAASLGKRLTGSPFDQSRFAVPPAQTRFAARIPLGSLASGLALVALVIAVSMGGYTLLQNVQRVGFAPLPEAPDVVADAPRLTAPDYTQAALSRPDAADYAENGPLASVYAPDDQPPILRRDGPISAINPGSYGVFAEIAAASEVTARALERQSVSNGWQTASEPERGVAETRAIRQAEGPAAEAAPILAAATTPAAPKGVSVHATGEAWIRVRNDQRAVIFEGILKPGQSFDLPPRVLAGELRAGNAGDVYVVVNGEPFGPIGKSGGVVKNLSLTEAEIRAAFPAADRSALSIGRDTPAEQRAAALQ